MLSIELVVNEKSFKHKSIYHKFHDNTRFFSGVKSFLLKEKVENHWSTLSIFPHQFLQIHRNETKRAFYRAKSTFNNQSGLKVTTNSFIWFCNYHNWYLRFLSQIIKINITKSLKLTKKINTHYKITTIWINCLFKKYLMICNWIKKLSIC